MLWGTHTTAEHAHDIINLALDNGIDFFDTAQIYPTFPYRKNTFGDLSKYLFNAKDSHFKEKYLFNNFI